MQAKLLEELYQKYNRFFVSFPVESVKTILKGEKIYYAFYPTNRNIINLFRNLGLAVFVLLKERPGVIISTGAGIAVPFFWVGRILGLKCIYIESITRSEELSLTAKLVLPFADYVFVQWPVLKERIGSKKGKILCKGSII